METGPTTWTGCPYTGRVGKKTGSVFLLLGIFLFLVGIAFSITSFLEYASGLSMEWAWLLGPIMLSVGGVFMLISVCILFPCLTGERAEEEEEEAEEEQRGAAELSFVFHCATQFSPPPYDSLAPQLHHPHHQQHPVGESAGPPWSCFHHLFPVENAAFTSEDGFPLGCGRALTSQTRSRVPDGLQGEEKDEGNSSTCSPPPPAYKDIFPPA